MGYTPPTAIDGVYFTKNLTQDTYNAGTSLLSEYWRNSVLANPPYYPITNYTDFIAFLANNYPTFIESLGDQLSSLDIGTLNQAMDAVAAKGQTTYPRPSDFNNAIEAVGGHVNIETVLADTASDVASEVVNFTQGFFTVLVVVVVVVVAGVAYYKSGGKVPKIKIPKDASGAKDLLKGLAK